MAVENGFDNVIQLGPTPDDMARFAAACTPLARHFRRSDSCPLEYPDLKPGEQLVFDYNYDSSGTGQVELNRVVVESHDQMMKIWTAVRHNLVGPLGWQVIAKPDLTGLSADGH